MEYKINRGSVWKMIYTQCKKVYKGIGWPSRWVTRFGLDPLLSEPLLREEPACGWTQTRP